MPEGLSSARRRSPLLVAAAGWVLPGLGYALIGERTRAWVVGATVLALFVLGMLIAGVRVIDVPGYGRDGQRTMIQVPSADARGRPMPGEAKWSLTQRPVAELFNKPWFALQVLNGPVCVIGARVSLGMARAGYPPAAKVRLGEIGTLYTAVAGVLNLLAIMDAGWRASGANDDRDDAADGATPAQPETAAA